MMVKQQWRTNRCLVPATMSSVTQVRFPVCPVQRRQPTTQQVLSRTLECSATEISGSGQCCSSTTTEGDNGQPGPDGALGPTETKRQRLDRPEEAAAVTNKEKTALSYEESEREGGCTQGSHEGLSLKCSHSDQQRSAELTEDSKTAELQSVASLKVTIQQSSESREFGQTDRTIDRPTGGLHCHVCNLTCRSAQVFQEHMATSEHLKKIKEITSSISLNPQTLHERGHRTDSKRWCDTCQTHFSGDVVIHRRTKQHKMCKQLSRPFCSVCKCHFRTPRKFVEHMKSTEHKQRVQLEEAQEEELIIVDAVGCFEGEEEGEEEEDVEVANLEEEEDDLGQEEAKEGVLKEPETGETDKEYDPHTAYGSSFVVPVSGFLCQLCNKFFYRETTARHTHCRTHSHYLNLQSHRAQKRLEGEDRSALT